MVALALTGIEPASRQFSSVQFGLSSVRFSSGQLMLVNFETAENPVFGVVMIMLYLLNLVATRDAVLPHTSIQPSFLFLACLPQHRMLRTASS